MRKQIANRKLKVSLQASTQPLGDGAGLDGDRTDSVGEDQQPNPGIARCWKTKREMAEHLRCTQRYINTLMLRRVLPFVKHRGYVRFDVDECDRALERFKTRSLFEERPGSPQPHLPAVIPPVQPGNPRLSSSLSPIGPKEADATRDGVEALAFTTASEARNALERIETGAEEDASRRAKQVLTVIVVLHSVKDGGPEGSCTLNPPADNGALC